MPDLIDENALDKGVCDIPKWLELFWKTALSGVGKKAKDRVNRLSRTYASDSIYCITLGRVKPRKHILLGVAIKSITGSEKVMKILNRLNYCISDAQVRELETSAAYCCSSTEQVCPAGIKKTNILAAAVAWDNFDRYVETQSGKNTLHDTVGIMSQDIATQAELTDIAREQNADVNVPLVAHSVRDIHGRSKRSFQEIQVQNFDAAKRSRPQFCSTDFQQTEDPEKLKTFQETLFAWVISHLLQIEGTPAWTGFNGKIYDDKSRVQKIEYLTQINSSPILTL